MTTTARSDSSNFAGPYFGVTASGWGMQLAGSARTSPTGGTYEEDEVSLGQIGGVVGIEVGYAVPIGSAFLIDIGGSYHQGEAKMDFHDNSAGQAAIPGDPTDEDTLADRAVSFKVDDLVSYYIAPTIVLSDTSSLYVKVGLTEADIGVSGNVSTPGDLSGTTWAIGTRTVLESGIFIKTEAGYTDYNAISVHGNGTSIAAANSYSADPTVAFGTVALGFRF